MKAKIAFVAKINSLNFPGKIKLEITVQNKKLYFVAYLIEA